MNAIENWRTLPRMLSVQVAAAGAIIGALRAEWLLVVVCLLVVMGRAIDQPALRNPIERGIE